MRFKKGQAPWNKGLHPEYVQGENHPMYGKTHSIEARKKLSESHKGQIAWNKGKKTSTETLEKLSRIRKGRVSWNKGLKGVMTAWNKGLSASTETKRKLSIAHKGQVAWNKGIPISDEQKEKLRKANSGRKQSIATRKKKSDALRAEKAPNWKGGITNLGRTIRASLEYKLWRQAIFKRDNYTCQMCKVRGGKLHVDHYPDTFSDIMKRNNVKSIEGALSCKELWNIKNNRTLCIECHKKTPTFLNNGNKYNLA